MHPCYIFLKADGFKEIYLSSLTDSGCLMWCWSQAKGQEGKQWRDTENCGH